MGPFVQILAGATLIAVFGDDTTARIMYDTETVPVTSAPGAECLTVSDGKITTAASSSTGPRSRSLAGRGPASRDLNCASPGGPATPVASGGPSGQA
jgi:hypothetical protein